MRKMKILVESGVGGSRREMRGDNTKQNMLMVWMGNTSSNCSFGIMRVTRADLASSPRPAFLFSHPPGNLGGFGKIANVSVFSKRPFPPFPCLLPSAHFLFVFSHSASLCVLWMREMEGHPKDGGVKEKREKRGGKRRVDVCKKPELVISNGEKREECSKRECLCQDDTFRDRAARSCKCFNEKHMKQKVSLSERGEQLI